MPQSDHRYAVIMAGGGGTRLWPVSRQKSPKQLLVLFQGKTLFEIAIERLAGLLSYENILVVTIQDQAEKLKKLVPQIPDQNYLIEPMPRGTAAVIALAAAAIYDKDPEGIMVVLTADHFIDNVHTFQKVLQIGCECAKKKDLVTLGIQPTFPSTGYGYIETGERMRDVEGKQIFRVAKIVEKPDENRAVDFIKSGKYLWNSGMFIWQASEILNEFEKFMPDLSRLIKKISPSIGKSYFSNSLIQEWNTLTPQTIDYGIMEKSERVVVIPVEDIGWSDVGSWDSLFDVLEPDENGNIVIGDKIHPLETRNTLVFSKNEDKILIPLGVNNMIIVNTPDALLICPRGESQKVKLLVEYLKANHYTLFL